jgi:hypothetical protein
MSSAVPVNTTMSPPPKGVFPATKLGMVVAALAAGPQQAAGVLPNKLRGQEGHIANVAALAGLHISEAEPVSETYKTMVGR